MAEQSQPSGFELKDYKVVRTHKMLRERVRTLLQPKPKPKTSSNISSSCILMGASTDVPRILTKNFRMDVKGNQLAMYSPTMYAQCSFDCIYRQARDIWPRIQQHRSEGNLLLVYFQQSPLNRNVFLNEYLVGKFLRSEEKLKTDEVNFGLLERAVISTLEDMKEATNEQLLISVLGVTGSNIVDLLNLEQTATDQRQIKRIRVKREGRGVQTENLSQIALDSTDSLLNVLMLAQYLKTQHKEFTGQRIEAEVYQLSVGKMSASKDQIEQILRKLNFVRLSEESLAANSLGSCLKEIAEGFPKVSARSSKLTFFLEDCLNRSSDIHLLYEIDTELPLKAQVSMLSFNTCINRPITLRKNYIGDREVISRLRQYGNELTLQNLFTMDSRDRNERILRKAKLGTKYDVRINRSLLAETTSSLHKRRSASNHPTPHNKPQNVVLPQTSKATSRLSERARYVHLKKVYRDV